MALNDGRYLVGAVAIEKHLQVISTAEEQKLMAERYANYLNHATRAQAALSKAQAELAKINREAKDRPTWYRDQRAAILNAAKTEVTEALSAGRVSYMRDRVNNPAPRFRSWDERQYQAFVSQQDTADMDAGEVLAYYRSNAGRISPEARQDLDRVCRNKLRSLGQPEALDTLADARRDFLTEEEALHENRERELDRVWQSWQAIEEWGQVAVKELQTGETTKVNLSETFLALVSQTGEGE